jgi:hypothetical protein
MNDYKALLAVYNRYNNLLSTKFYAVHSAIEAMLNALDDLSPELYRVFYKDARIVIAASAQQSQQARSALLTNDVVALANTVGDLSWR